MAVSVLVALIGIWPGLVFLSAASPAIPERGGGEAGAGLYRLLYNKYYVDQIYDAMFVNRAKDLGTTLGAFDVGVINGLGVDGVGWLTRVISQYLDGVGQVD